jgi:hypothetical protein
MENGRSEVELLTLLNWWFVFCRNCQLMWKGLTVEEENIFREVVVVVVVEVVFFFSSAGYADKRESEMQMQIQLISGR